MRVINTPCELFQQQQGAAAALVLTSIPGTAQPTPAGTKHKSGSCAAYACCGHSLGTVQMNACKFTDLRLKTMSHILLQSIKTQTAQVTIGTGGS